MSNETEGNLLPEDFASSDESYASFKTVEELGTAYKGAMERASSIGSIESIPEELRADPNIKKYKDIGELAKGHLETVKLIGRKGVIVPNENSPKEDIDKFFNSIGRPEKADLYQFVPKEGLNEAIQPNEESIKAYKDIAHKTGLTQAQASALNDWYMETMNNQLNQQANANSKSREDSETKLRGEWGKDYPDNLLLAQKVVMKYGGQEAAVAFGELGNNTAVLKMLANMGKKVSEDALARGEISDLSSTPKDARRKLDDLNRKILNMKQDSPEYQDVLKERMELYKVAYPAESA